jgi:hypothetical protein
MVSRERLDRTIVTLAYIVVKHGAKYAPLLECAEAEYRARFSDPVGHARDILERAQKRPYRTVGHDSKAIRLSTD